MVQRTIPHAPSCPALPCPTTPCCQGRMLTGHGSPSPGAPPNLIQAPRHHRPIWFAEPQHEPWRRSQPYLLKGDFPLLLLEKALGGGRAQGLIHNQACRAALHAYPTPLGPGGGEDDAQEGPLALRARVHGVVCALRGQGMCLLCMNVCA